VSALRLRQHIRAPRARVYQALVDARAVAVWMVPAGMTSQVQGFNALEGGTFRISLTYDDPTNAGKTSAHTDTYHGRFVKLVPGEQVVWTVEFETADPSMRGTMTITFTLADGPVSGEDGAEGSTDLFAVHDGLPRGLSTADNELGWRLSLGKLAALVESGPAGLFSDT
jgi:uncharacterized protein YndB with AHSA1/START domain